MSNYEKLKELAEATKGWDNLKSCWPEETEDGDLEVNWFVGAVTEDDDKYPVLEVNTAQYDAFEDAGRLARYYAAANPAAVLALIAENERLGKERITEHQSLRSDRARNSLYMMIATSLIDDHPYERGGSDWDYEHPIHDKIISLLAERDQLRAEVAGLRTGYEAYERVNAELKQKVANFEVCQTASLGMSGIIKCVAGELGFDAAGEDSAQDYLIGLARRASELKAENEALRKERDARHPFKPFHEPAIGFTGCVICGVYTDHGGLPCPKTRATADAALGQGEQS